MTLIDSTFCRLLEIGLATILIVVSVLSEAPSQEERDAVLEFHTAKRGNVTPSAANMKMMVRYPLASLFLYLKISVFIRESIE